jgi:hypothetical protein
MAGNLPFVLGVWHRVITRLSKFRHERTDWRLLAGRVWRGHRGGCLHNQGRLVCVVARTGHRSPRRALLSFIALTSLVAGAGCGFGRYDDSAAPQVTSATTGVPDAGQWWPWACPDGASPSPASTPLDYTASGSCGNGGPFALSVDGCEMFGNWSTLGLSDVQTLQPTSTPSLGGWIVSGTPSAADGGLALGDGGVELWNCEATQATGGALAFTCSDAISLATTCQSSLTPVSGQ